ncbi:hypothetical protein BST33_12570 [Mycolicibacter minnesotensis]|uniref:Uncharacterized protein n=2 Tax=Mycolicibacter minnesotensis TaxID=1118379 RepID=A0A7I7R5L4_9MYCO|nr:hypothetical protein BST33_12570 [Mycolicibacter minnesotensis]BBY33938.1 hypothetical protein MMIN_19990 [Mycolicibacter minnesotensis]
MGEWGVVMSLWDAHMPQVGASESAFGAQSAQETDTVTVNARCRVLGRFNSVYPAFSVVTPA